MNHRTAFILLPIFALVLMASECRASSQASVLFEKAKFTMETKGDLHGAIELFNEIIAKYPGEREYAAKSQLYIGLCYDKQGKEQARRAYQKVIQEYADQRDVAAQARTRLAALERPLRAIEQKGIKIRQVLGPWDDGVFCSPSPDGKYLTYVDWDSGDLAIYEIATEKTRRLTGKGSWEGSNDYPIWSDISPDNKLVAYDWHNVEETLEEFCHLCIIGIDGSNPRIILGHENRLYFESVAWSSDGEHIATILWEKENESSSIIRVSVADGSYRRLKKLGYKWPPGKRFHSPDDKYIAYSYWEEEDSANCDIYLLATDGSGESILVEHPADDRVLGWVPARDEVLFLSDRTGNWDAWLIRVKDGKAMGEPILVKRNLGQVEPLGFAESGSYFFGLHEKWMDISIAGFDPDSGKLSSAIEHPFVGSNSYPVWSPDCSYLACLSGQDREEALHIRSLVTGEDREIPVKLKRILPLSWSPDGRYLLVCSYLRMAKSNTKKFDLYTIDVSTGKTTVLVEDLNLAAIASPRYGEWAPDGKSIFYVNQDIILRHEIDTGREKEIYHNPGKVLGPLALSRGGRFLAFCMRDSASAKALVDILVISIEGGEARELFRGNFIRELECTPDGRYVLFKKHSPGISNASSLWSIPAEGGEPSKIWESDKGFGYIHVCPDGRQIVFGTSEWTVEVWVMENFLP